MVKLIRCDACMHECDIHMQHLIQLWVRWMVFFYFVFFTLVFGRINNAVSI